MILRSKVQIAPLSLDAQEPRRFNTRPFEVTTSKFAQVAQLVEQGIENPRVGGSIPSLGTIPKQESPIALAASLLRPVAFTHF